MLWQRVGWLRPHGRPLLLPKATVKTLTSLQAGLQHTVIREKHAAFLLDAAIGTDFDLDALHTELRSVMRHLWRLPWDNSRKEVYWRLALDGLPSAARMHLTGAVCDCGQVAPGRNHHFWDCPVAQAVVQVLQGQLPQPNIVRRVNLWLCRPPTPQIHTGVWMVVCLAALLSINKGRKLLYKLSQVVPPVSVQQRVVTACTVAVATLWDMLADFVGVGMSSPDWLQAIGHAHPFLHAVPNAGGELHLAVNHPN
jgi:hypothetical protein